MRGKTGTARPLQTTLMLDLKLTDGAVSGHGYSADFPYDCDYVHRTVEIVGEAHGDGIGFSIVFTGSPHFSTRRFVFAGRFSADRRTLAGRWTYRCEACTCEGPAGVLELVSVEY